MAGFTEVQVRYLPDSRGAEQATVFAQKPGRSAADEREEAVTMAEQYLQERVEASHRTRTQLVNEIKEYIGLPPTTDHNAASDEAQKKPFSQSSHSDDGRRRQGSWLDIFDCGKPPEYELITQWKSGGSERPVNY